MSGEKEFTNEMIMSLLTEKLSVKNTNNSNIRRLMSNGALPDEWISTKEEKKIMLDNMSVLIRQNCSLQEQLNSSREAEMQKYMSTNEEECEEQDIEVNIQAGKSTEETLCFHCKDAKCKTIRCGCRKLKRLCAESCSCDPAACKNRK